MNVCIADFFCGVGGIRLGFELASKETEINCSFSNDMEPKCNELEKEFTRIELFCSKLII